jgi:hypothetical protein
VAKLNKKEVAKEHAAYKARAHVVGDRQPPKTGPAQEAPKKVKKAAKAKTFTDRGGNVRPIKKAK